MKQMTAIALSVIAFNLATAVPADAALFNWTNESVEESNNQAWSFDSLYQDIQGFSFEPVKAMALEATAVASVTNPATSKAKPKTKVKTFLVSASAYSSTPDQTDSTPFITAKGTYVRDGIVAANFLPFGTAIKIPEIYGDKIFIVEDRMNKRYWHNVDIWFSSREAAKQFGRKTVTIEIVS